MLSFVVHSDSALEWAQLPIRAAQAVLGVLGMSVVQSMSTGGYLAFAIIVVIGVLLMIAIIAAAGETKAVRTI